MTQRPDEAGRFAGAPFADQYVGVWSILESHANALLQQAQQINVQLHLQQFAQNPEQQAVVAAQGSTELNVTRDGIAIVELSGALQKHASSMIASRSTVAARRQVRAAAKSDEVAGILLHIDSPGGMVAGTVDLADDIARAKESKPVFAYIEDLGASAAYWIASQADKVFANRSAEVGSIGVFMVVTDWSAAASMMGGKVHVIRFGEFKGAGVAGTEVTAAQIEKWQGSVDSFGAMFIDAVALGRRMAKSRVKELANGAVFTASDALDRQLIDGIDTLDATLAALTTAANRKKRSAKAMTETLVQTQDTPATLTQLKRELPDASAEFVMQQLESNATLGDAIKDYAAKMRDDLAQERQAREAAEKEAADLKAKATAVKSSPAAHQVRGNRLASTASSGEPESTLDYFQLAKDYQQQHKCRWSEACLEIKHRYPESREVFGAPKAESR